MISDFQPLIDWLNANPNWILFSLGFTAFLESLALVGIIIPGVAILFVIAAIAGGTDITLASALLAAFMGAVLGDGISFYIGYIFKEKLPEKWPFSRFPEALKTGQSFFQKHGGKSVVIGRFVGPIRPVLPIIAGMMGMSQLRFITFNFASALAWAPFYVLPGYWSGAAMQTDMPNNVITVIISALLLLALTLLLFRFLSLKAQQGNRWHEVIEIERASSPTINKIWLLLTKYHHEPKEFPLASLSLLVICSTLFWTWTLLVLHTSWLQGIDQTLLDLSVYLRSDVFDSTLVFFTLVGNEGFLYVSFFLLVGLLTWKQQYIAALHVAAGGLLTAAVTHSFKAWFAISRPDLVTNAPTSFAYPSGHSSGAVIFWGLLASLVAQDIDKQKRWRVYMIFFIPMLLIAWSRVFLGVHWFSDIIGGILLGLALCGLTRVSYSRYNAAPLMLLTQNKKELMLFFTGWLLCLAVYQWWYFDNTLTQFQLK